MRARVHHVVCDFEGSCPSVTQGARHARSAIDEAARAGWTRVRKYDDGRWYVRDYCPTHSPKERTS